MSGQALPARCRLLPGPSPPSRSPRSLVRCALEADAAQSMRGGRRAFGALRDGYPPSPPSRCCNRWGVPPLPGAELVWPRRLAVLAAACCCSCRVLAGVACSYKTRHTRCGAPGRGVRPGSRAARARGEQRPWPLARPARRRKSAPPCAPRPRCAPTSAGPLLPVSLRLRRRRRLVPRQMLDRE